MIWHIEDQSPTIEGLDSHGRPDPAYAAALGIVRAPFGRRSVSLATDLTIWVILQVPFLIGALPLLLKLATGAISPYGLVNHPGFVLAVVMTALSMLFSLVYLVVQLVLHGVTGKTIGKALTGIRSVNVRTLERPGVGAVLLRLLIVVASGVVVLIGPALILISPTFDPERRGRGLHDKASKIWLVDVRKGLNPYDEKRMRVARKVVKAEPNVARSALPSLATPLDPGAEPEYRPGNRVSAGVLGIARPHEANARPAIGLSLATPPAPQGPAEAGRPVLGGYRSTGEKTPTAGGVAAPSIAADVPAPVQLASAQPEAAEPAPPQNPSVPATQPGSEPAQPAPQPAIAPQFGLRFDSGESIPITRPVLLGRNPDATGHPGAQTRALADDSKSLSKTHMLVSPVDGGLEIIDCGSTNGSGLVRAGTEYSVSSGAAVTAIDGDTIRLGDRVAAVVRI